uniref:Eukaryotic translation initiation factor 4 gamma, 1a n=1 Tax=Esox lucius TaxID=8010 RepID=A0AAY5JZH5_ESOLU
MNKPPQPITGPTSVPHPSPSPGLTQGAYATGQPPPLVFTNPPNQQMNSAPQPRQFATVPRALHQQFAAGPCALHQQGGYRALQPYYANRPAMNTSAPRVQTSSGPRPVGPAHVYQTGSQMMMIPGQQLSFTSSPQSYFIPPGQYRPPYMPASPQYPVSTGTAGFYPGTSPAEYPAYAGAYYPAQPQYSHTPPVQTAPVMISPAQPQQQALAPQLPQAQPPAPKRERVAIRIRDPNQGGRDITEEIMSGGRSTSTPTPPSQSSMTEGDGPAQTNGEVTKPVTMLMRTEESPEYTVSSLMGTTPPVPATSEPAAVPAEVTLEMEGNAAPPNEQVVRQSTAAPVGAEVPILSGEDQAPPSSPSPPAAPTSHPPSEVQTLPQVVAIAPISEEVDVGVATAVASEAPPKPEKPLATPAAVEKTPAPAVQKVKEADKKKVAPEEMLEKAEKLSTPVVQKVKESDQKKVVEEKIEKSEKEPVLTTPAEIAVPVVAAVLTEDPKPTPRPVTLVAKATVVDSPLAVKHVVDVEAPTNMASVTDPLLSKKETTPPPTVTEPAPVASTSVPVAEPTVPPKTEEKLSNGLPQECPDELDAPAPECAATPVTESVAPRPQVTAATAAEVEGMEEEKEIDVSSAPSAISLSEDTSIQAAVSVPKKKRNMKELNKKEAIGDMLDAFKEEKEALPPAPELLSAPAEPSPVTLPPADAPDETWEEKEDKQNADVPPPKPGDLKYQYKGEQWKPIDPEEKKRYDREFLLGFQFISASLNKPEGLPLISDVVLDKANKTPMRPAEPGRNMMNAGPDFTPAFMGNLDRQSGGGGGGGPRGPGRDHMGPPGPRRSQQGQRKEPRKIINISSSLGGDVQLNKAEKAWKPGVKKAVARGREGDDESDDPEIVKTQELFRRVRSILNKLTPQMFQQLMKQVTELTIDTEERLKGVIDLIFEKAISEPNFSVAYANMCRCLTALKVPTTDKPGVTVNFRKLLLNRCQKEFEKDQDDDVIFEAKQKEMEAAKEEEKAGLKADLEEARDKARRRSLGNIKFIGELFKLKMLTEAIMHDCIVKLLKNHDEESLECLCRLLSTIGKDLDFEKAKPRMDQYFAQMDKIIKEKKTSSRIRFMLQDVIDLRRSGWVPRRGEQGPKTIDQIHKEAELEEQMQQIKVQQQLLSRNDGGGPQDEGWNTVPITTKNRPIDTSRLSKITKVIPGYFWCSHSETLRPATSTLNRFSALQQSAQPTSSSDVDLACFVRTVKRETAPTPPPAALAKPVMTEDELDKKSSAIIEEYLHLNDMKEALQCVVELHSAPLLFVFVRNGLENTLERSAISRERMGMLLHQLIKTGTLPTTGYYKGLQEILEVAEDMAIDIPHIWQYLAELIVPMLHEGGIPMGQLFREITKPLIPLGKAGVLLVQILNLLCKGMTHKKVGSLWREAGLNWRDFLPEDEDINKFVTEQKIEFTLGEESEQTNQKKPMSGDELSEQLDRLIQDKADNQRIQDWVEANLDDQQVISNQFVRALMTSVCQSAIICESPYRVDGSQITQRAKLLQRYLSDEQKELQALYALQALMVHMEQPANLLRSFFDTLYDEDVIKEEAFYKWESSKDPAEQTGKGVALKSVTAFFTWLREAEEESDKE